MSNIEQTISSYGMSANRIRQDISTVTKQYPSLNAIADTFFYNNGNSNLLLCFTGTLPIKYNNNNYFIPIKVWIEKDYPRICPNVYVTPTQGMGIKPKHKHVDSTGKCYFPYLNQWNQQNCHILGLLFQMAQAFSEDPPVFAKSTSQPNLVQQPQYNPNPQPQYPVKQPMSNPYPPPQYQPNPNPNMPPQYPNSNPYPINNQYPPNNNQYPVNNQYPPNNNQYPNQPTYPINNQYPLNNQYPPNNNQYPVNNQYPNMNNNMPNNNQYYNQPQVDPKLELISKLSSLLVTELERQAKVIINEANDMNKIQLELTNRESTIENTVSSYNNEIASLGNAINFYQMRINMVDEWISKNSSNEEISVDSIVVPTSVLSNQLLVLVAENFAIDDTIHKLTDAFYQNVVDQDFFVKNMRDLSRDQYLKLALIKKITQVLGTRGINI